jgi:hypothetical protein
MVAEEEVFGGHKSKGGYRGPRYSDLSDIFLRKPKRKDANEKE